MNLLKRIIFSIPILRHKATEQNLEDFKEELKLVDLVNRLISCIVVKNVVSFFNEGKFRLEDIESPQFYRNYAKHMLGEKVSEIVSKIRVERTIISSESCKVILVHLPSSNEIGQASMVGFIIKDKEAFGYSLEHSVKNLLMICQWEEDRHYNFGTATDKVDFVKKIVKLSKYED